MAPQLENCSQPSAARKNPCLKTTTDKLYEQRPETGDVKFIVEDEKIPAHRCVLAALSPKYKAQFYGALPEKDVVNVSGVSSAAFREFLQFFYMDEVTLTIENIEDVLNLAKQSLVDELVSECTNFLLDSVEADKLIWFYRLAIRYEIEPLKEFCVERISSSTKILFQTTDFLSCEQEMLSYILDLDELNCNETDVVDACIAWARTKCEQSGIDAASTSNLRAALGDAIFKIRFCSMTAEQFANINKRYSGFLLLQESIEVFQAILLKGSGETSSIFGANNSKPRKQKQSFVECSFSKGFPQPFISSADFLDFSCDTAILLSGFVICNEIHGSISIRIQLAGVPQNVDCTKSTSDNETRILFENPIHVAASKLCRIDIEYESVIWQKFLIEEIVRQNGVSFRFGIAHKFYNSFTRLLYNNNSVQ